MGSTISIYCKPNANIFAEAVAEKIAIINPYESPASVGFIPSKTANLVTEIQRTFWFLFGVIVGRLFSRCVLDGLADFLNRLGAKPFLLVTDLLVFPLICLLLSSLWRLPRRHFGAGEYISSLVSFFSGMLMVLSATLVSWAVHETGWYPSGMFGGMLVSLVVLLVCCVLAVECEFVVTRVLRKR